MPAAQRDWTGVGHQVQPEASIGDLSIARCTKRRSSHVLQQRRPCLIATNEDCRRTNFITRYRPKEGLTYGTCKLVSKGPTGVLYWCEDYVLPERYFMRDLKTC